MEDLRKIVLSQLKEIETLINKSDKILYKLCDLPNEKLEVSRSNGVNQFYWVDNKSKTRKYAKKSEMAMIKKILQRDYELVVNAKLKKQQKTLERFINNYDITGIDNVYNKMSDARKALITPIIEPDDMFVANWLNDEYEPMPISDDIKFYSNNGTRVRSKSELIIVNMLEQYEIPYKYEKPLMLNGLGMIRPDIQCLNVRTRSEFIWEHFGMMDDQIYANKNISKINLYQENGYLVGKNMITSFESSKNPLNPRVIKQLIEEYLL